MCGIYKITNMINNKVYVGKSKNIKQRWGEHKRHFKYNDNLLYKAMRKHGIENFSFEILELCLIDELEEKEAFWIKQLDCCVLDGKDKGYNMTRGREDITPKYGEENPNAKVTNELVFSIREDYKNGVLKKVSYEKCKGLITKNTFHDIWTGKTWKDIHMDVYTPENKQFQKNNRDTTCHSRKISDEDVLKIRDLKNEGKTTFKEVKEMFSHINVNTIRDVWLGRTFKHIQSKIPDNYKKNMRLNTNGANNPSAKLTEYDVIDIRTRKNNGELFQEVIKDYSFVHKNTFKKVWNNKTYKNVIVKNSL